MSTGRESDKFMLRLPDGMRERIKEVADASGRSMNAEIVFRLNASLSYNSMEDMFADQLAQRDQNLAERRRDAEALASLIDDLADQISEKVIADLKGQDRPASSLLVLLRIKGNRTELSHDPSRPEMIRRVLEK